ncbi:telomerase reverse transcriptase [Diplodia corticola]|uniref:Telomerase reverse transcriptase n=1 Tax=Diplodia corticola TaxID=236234 RepID=A0A1J9RRM6_9PEZI|nr:telomerase reverse transcriptase [Diplodia corticola]OJD31087.1 telomerase reverse transcriptase [Diplodia corticola]
MKRKRSASDAVAQARPRHTTHPTHPVLQRFYPQVLPLRQFLLSRLAGASTRKRRRIAQLGLGREPTAAPGAVVADDLRILLDDTWVGAAHHAAPAERADLEKDLEVLSQELPSSSSPGDVCPELQSEIVDFVIRSLFKKHPGLHRPPHVLCHGYERASCPDRGPGPLPDASPNMSGIVSRYPNSHVKAVKGPAWSALLVSLGSGGDRIMVELLMNCGVFASLDGPSGGCYQLSGKSLADLEPIFPHRDLQNKSAQGGGSIPAPGPKRPRYRGPDSLTAITFVRSRMLYARAALNAKGEVRFGLRHIHVLNRLSDHTSLKQTIHILKYIFPRQFGLHNVFTCKTNFRETSQPFKDYTLREQEISRDLLRRASGKGRRDSKSGDIKDVIPRRLRGHAVDLVRRFRVLHRRCSYVELLHYYCPTLPEESQATLNGHGHQPWSRDRDVEKSDITGASGLQQGAAPAGSSTHQACFTDMATPEYQVEAFCRSIMKNVVPSRLWGEGETQAHNSHAFLAQVGRFVRLRRFESLTLHEVMQDMKITGVAWLQPPNAHPGHKMSQSDFTKRRELLAELIYYLFDSFLILLIRTNFHVTESNADKNRLYYFRHDVWRKLTEPVLAHLKTTTFEEIKADRATRILSSRQLGYSQVRLLPKKIGARPITNLRRRVQITVNGRSILGRSINSVMKPVFSILNLEKSHQPERLGSSLFSVGEMYSRLKAFRFALAQRGLVEKPLYFVKVDVKSCFDTIPQKRLLDIVRDLLSLDDYRVKRHVEVNSAISCRYSSNMGCAVKPVKKYLAQARGTSDARDFAGVLRTQSRSNPRNAVFVDSVVEQRQSKEEVMKLLTEHVERNIIKIGKKYYRQKTGIPQGSVLSSLLCSFFYAELEADLLGFLGADTSVLLRLIDDSLLITTERQHAERFLRVMYEGNEDYGVGVTKEKTLLNFGCSVDGAEVPRLPSLTSFPYCGTLINTRNLNISKDFGPKAPRELRNGLTVEFSKLPGQTFHRKTLNALKMQLHAMLLDTSFNLERTVLGNLYRCFADTARKCCEYLRCLPARKRSSDSLLIKTVHDVAALAAATMRRKKEGRRAAAWQGYQCEVSRRHTQWLCYRAFQSVFQRRPTKHALLLRWLAARAAAGRPRAAAERAALAQAASAGSA